MNSLSSRAWVVLGTVIAVIGAASLAWGGYRYAAGDDGGIPLLISGLALTVVTIVCWAISARLRKRL